MAFNNIGRAWLANGASVWVMYHSAPHGVGVDRGAQWIMAHPEPYDTFPMPDGLTQLESGKFSIRFLSANGGAEWSYYCLVSNTSGPGGNATWFSLSGGGNT
jgi:hypothetical protein